MEDIKKTGHFFSEVKIGWQKPLASPHDSQVFFTAFNF